MDAILEVLFTPAEFSVLPQRDLSRTVCLVFDVLRATSSMVTALANGAVAIKPVESIAEALALRQQDARILLAGERYGWRIRAEQTGGVDFDLGNSPREYVAEKVSGCALAMTTTNGTRALRSCVRAQRVLAGAFLNLPSLIRWLQSNPPSHLLLVCSGTFEEAALEDTLAAGAVCHALWDHYCRGPIADSAAIARQLFQSCQDHLTETVTQARNGRRLLSQPELHDDVAFAMQIGRFEVLAELNRDGWIRTITAESI
jgi:2-phosphosulfolactate phosphatase